MITVGFKPAKAEIKYPPQVMLRDVQGEEDRQCQEEFSFVHPTNELRASSQSAPVKQGHSRSTLRDANHAGQEHCCRFIIRKIKFSSKRQYTLLHLIGTQKK